LTTPEAAQSSEISEKGFILSRLGLVTLAIVSVLYLLATAAAETPAPTVHWGGIAHPDQFNILQLGATFNRFTEFDGAGTRAGQPAIASHRQQEGHRRGCYRTRHEGEHEPMLLNSGIISDHVQPRAGASIFRLDEEGCNAFHRSETIGLRSSSL
jgi:hypothetical protein